MLGNYQWDRVRPGNAPSIGRGGKRKQTVALSCSNALSHPTDWRVSWIQACSVDNMAADAVLITSTKGMQPRKDGLDGGARGQKRASEAGEREEEMRNDRTREYARLRFRVLYTSEKRRYIIKISGARGV